MKRPDRRVHPQTANGVRPRPHNGHQFRVVAPPGAQPGLLLVTDRFPPDDSPASLPRCTIGPSYNQFPGTACHLQPEAEAAEWDIRSCFRRDAGTARHWSRRLLSERKDLCCRGPRRIAANWRRRLALLPPETVCLPRAFAEPRTAAESECLRSVRTDGLLRKSASSLQAQAEDDIAGRPATAKFCHRMR